MHTYLLTCASQERSAEQTDMNPNHNESQPHFFVHDLINDVRVKGHNTDTHSDV